MMGLVACSENSSPSQGLQDLVAKNDHAGLETWYIKEAAHLRQREKDMALMVERYQKLQNKPGTVSAKIALIEHCKDLSATYAKAADEAEVIARSHRDMKGNS